MSPERKVKPLTRPDTEIVVPTQLSRGEFIYAYSLVTSLFFAWGFAYGLLDSLNKHFQQVFGITKTQSTFMQVSYFGAYFLWAPWAGAFMRRVGYKNGIYAGLTMYSLGASEYRNNYLGYSTGQSLLKEVMPDLLLVLLQETYDGVHTLTSDRSVLSSYPWASRLWKLLRIHISQFGIRIVLGDSKYGAMRLTFSQAWNGIGAFAGPLIASQEFFKGENNTSLANVQWVYLAVGGWCPPLAKLPEVNEAKLDDTLTDQTAVAPLHKQYHLIFGFWAQFSYVGAQVAVATFCTNFFADTPSIGFAASKASLWYSYNQMVFALGRFMGAVLLNGACLDGLSPGLLSIYDRSHLWERQRRCCIHVLSVIPVVRRANMSSFAAHTHKSSSFLKAFAGWGHFNLQLQQPSDMISRDPAAYHICTGNRPTWPSHQDRRKLRSCRGRWRSGMALSILTVVRTHRPHRKLYAPLQGVLSDKKNVQIGYWVAFAGFANALAYGVGMCIDKERRKHIDSKTGRKLKNDGQFSYAEGVSIESDTKDEKIINR
ncbi:hypothetical protein BU17DRAFT_101020 [Hysterangium stoloniferum]|nr:hypothetical protein BU17DRAFT_101020 [Hysterangium stoloniferum]